jgi:tetratricopeptide (TPR) repeat protein
MVMHFANEQEALEALRADDLDLAATAEGFLWTVWCRSGDSEVDQIFRAGVDAMQKGELARAEGLFSQVIKANPGFAEGWNKRATVRYVMKQFGDSIADCLQTLARNPNHFGAAAGQGLCHLSVGQFSEAAICFRRALEIHPHLNGVRHNLALAEAKGGGSGYLH